MTMFSASNDNLSCSLVDAVFYLIILDELQLSVHCFFSFRNRETLTFPPFSALPHIHSRQFLFIMLSTCEKPLRLSGEISRGRELKTGMSGTRSCSPFISPSYQVIAESFIYSDLCSGLKRPGCPGLSKFSALCPCTPANVPRNAQVSRFCVCDAKMSRTSEDNNNLKKQPSQVAALENHVPLTSNVTNITVNRKLYSFVLM